MREDRHNITANQTAVPNLGPSKIDNPAAVMCGPDGSACKFTTDEERVLVNPYPQDIKGKKTPPTFELAGPRSQIYFDPTKLKAAIVTCGGMCPGINSLVRSIVLQLYYIYGVRNIVGVRFGLQGFIPSFGHQMMELNPRVVQNVHGRGGCFLGMSRGPQPMEDIVDSLERQNIGLLFMIGGDGTLRAGQAIYKEITQRKMKIGVICIPKTIDNDISFVERSFGFETAVEAATGAIRGAHNEATGAPNGVGLVKLMGRLSGFVAAQATLALADVNFCLIPEVDFDLEGEHGLLAQLERRLDDRGHGGGVGGGGSGTKALPGQGPGHRPQRQPGAGRYRRLPEAKDQRIFQGQGQAPNPEVHRPQLPDPFGARQQRRPGVHRLFGPPRGARGHERTHRHAGVHVGQPLRARADTLGHRTPPPGGPPGRPMARGARGHGPTVPAQFRRRRLALVVSRFFALVPDIFAGRG